MKIKDDSVVCSAAEPKYVDEYTPRLYYSLKKNPPFFSDSRSADQKFVLRPKLGMNARNFDNQRQHPVSQKSLRWTKYDQKPGLFVL
jgi:hypothetical protein